MVTPLRTALAAARAPGIAVMLASAALTAPDAAAQRARDPAGMLPLARKRAPQCTALAPESWIVQGRPDGQAMELASAEGAYGGWGIAGFDAAMGGYYAQYRSPESFVIASVQGLGVADARFASGPQQYQGFIVRRLTGTGTTGRPVDGFVLYRVYPAPGSPGSTIVSERIAIALRDRPDLLRVAAAAALSIRCAATPNPAPRTERGGAAAAGRDESAQASTYNRQLGTEYYHDPKTGENFLIDDTKLGHEAPEHCVGNWCTKLEHGRSDP